MIRPWYLLHIWWHTMHGKHFTLMNNDSPSELHKRKFQLFVVVCVYQPEKRVVYLCEVWLKPSIRCPVFYWAFCKHALDLKETHMVHKLFIAFLQRPVWTWHVCQKLSELYRGCYSWYLVSVVKPLLSYLDLVLDIHFFLHLLSTYSTIEWSLI